MKFFKIKILIKENIIIKIVNQKEKNMKVIFNKTKEKGKE